MRQVKVVIFKPLSFIAVLLLKASHFTSDLWWWLGFSSLLFHKSKSFYALHSYYTSREMFLLYMECMAYKDHFFGQVPFALGDLQSAGRLSFTIQHVLCTSVPNVCKSSFSSGLIIPQLAALVSLW